MTDRNTYFDYIRGIAIVMVVCIHTYSSGNNVELRQVLNAAVPMFIAVSGFFLSKKMITNRGEYLAFLKKQVSKVYLPTIVWSLPLFAYALYTEDNIGVQFLKLMFCGFSIYYFIVFIVQCYIVLPVVTSILSGCYFYLCVGGVILSSIISLTWIGTITWLTVVKGMAFSLVVYAGPLPCWIMFFVLGVALGQHPSRKYSLWLPILITSIGLGLSMCSARYLFNYNYSGVGIKPSAFIYAFGLILFLFNAKVEKRINRNNKLYKCLVRVGNMSFAIYLIHMYIVTFVVKQLSLDNWLFRAIFTMAFTILVIVIMEQIVPKKLHKYMGL